MYIVHSFADCKGRHLAIVLETSYFMLLFVIHINDINSLKWKVGAWDTQGLANPLNPAMSPHSRHPSHWWNSERRKNREGGKTLNEPLHGPLHKRSTKNSQILAVYKATTNHVSLHLWDWPLDPR